MIQSRKYVVTTRFDYSEKGLKRRYFLHAFLPVIFTQDESQKKENGPLSSTVHTIR